MGTRLKGLSKLLDEPTTCKLNFGSLEMSQPYALLQLHLQVIELDIDAKVVILLSNNDGSFANFVLILDDCKQLMTQILVLKINHKFREANVCMDFLAKKGSRLYVILINKNVFRSFMTSCSF